VCVPGLVSSRTRPWGSTLQGFHLLQSRDASRRPAALLTFSRRRPRPTVHPATWQRVPRSRRARVFPRRRPSAVGRHPGSTDCSRVLSIGPDDPSRGRSRCFPEAFVASGYRWRFAGLRRVRLQGFSPCKELGTPGRLLHRSGAVALLGFTSPGHSRIGWGSAFRCRPSLSGFLDRTRSLLRASRRPLRASPASMPGFISRETNRPS